MEGHPVSAADFIQPGQGHACGAFGPRSPRRRCLLPSFHDGDHEDHEGTWHPKPPKRLGVIDPETPAEVPQEAPAERTADPATVRSPQPRRRR